MSTLENQILGNLVKEFHRRVIHESVPRIRKCLSLLTIEEIWRRPNENTVSVGNLVLHLIGNSRQWIISTFNQTPDLRKRQTEFDETGPIPTAQLLRELDTLASELEIALQGLTPHDLVSLRNVQVFEETGISILVHVIEHFSYHTGQITLHTKTLKNIDTGYYSGMKLGNK